MFNNILYAQEVYIEDKDIYVRHNGRRYIVYRYEVDVGYDMKYYVLQYWPKKDSGEMPEGLVLVFDKDNNLIKEFRNTEYYPEVIFYDIDNDIKKELILFWHCGAHSTVVEVWKRKDDDFEKLFEKFTDKSVQFKIMDGVPTLAFKKEYPMSTTNCNFPDKDFNFYKWDGETFTKDEH